MTKTPRDGSCTAMPAGTRSWGQVLRMRLFRWLALAPVLLLTLACAAPQASGPYVPPEPTAAPDIAATVAARDAALPQGGPAPTPVPEDVAQAVSDFAQAHAILVRDWNQVRKDMDSWRQGLDSCSPAALQTSLRGFSADFRQVALAAQDLPRDAAVREMSARLIEAVENEEAALRRLRDGGQPPDMPQSAADPEDRPEENGEEESNGTENNAPPSPGFEGVAQARAESVAARKEVEDQLIDLQELTGEESRSRVEAFAEALDALNLQWDRFHKDYDAFRAARPGLTPEDSLQRLDRLVEQHRSLVLAHRDLPVTPATQEAAEILAQAVQDEDAALRRLRGSFQMPGDGDGAVPPAPVSAPSGGMFGSTGSENETDGDSQGVEGGSAMESGPDPAPEPAGASPESASVGPGDPGLFDAFDEQVVLTNDLRWQAALALDKAQAGSSEQDRIAADTFAVAYSALLGRWQDFHRDYDRWLADEGGCDRAAVAKDLGGFTLRMGNIAASARSLPQSPPLRPLGELTVEAAQRETEALRLLRDSWTPFDPAVYQDLDRELAAAGSLRRQAQLALQQLLHRYGLSQP